MGSTSKKQIIRNLFADIEKTNDVDEYAEKRRILFTEVAEAGYPTESTRELAIRAANELCKDFDMNMTARIQNQPDPNDAHFMDLSKVGLLTLIDLSTLAEI